MNNKIDFNSPIKGGGQFRAAEAFDDYFFLSGRKYRVIQKAINASDRDYLVEEYNEKGNILLTALKIASYFTIIIPLVMLVGKAIARSQYNFYLYQKPSLETLNNLKESIAALKQTKKGIKSFRNELHGVWLALKSSGNKPEEVKVLTNRVKTLIKESEEFQLEMDPGMIQDADSLKRFLDNSEKSVNKRFEEAQLKVKFAKISLALKQGAIFKCDKGANGTLKLVNENGKLVGVFKPNSASTNLLVKIKHVFTRTFGGQISVLKNEPMTLPKGEVFSYKLDRFFGFNSVPPSMLAKFGTIEGAFQLSAQIFRKGKNYETENSAVFAHLLKEAEDARQVLNKKAFDERELEAFQRFAVHDFLLGNLDAHDQNWFVEEEGDKLKTVIGIDKANCMIERNPKKWTDAARKQYQWKKYKIAKQKFIPEVKELMLAITEDKVNEFISSLERDEGLSDFVNPLMKEKMLQRVAVIQHVATRDGLSTPKELARYCQDSDFKRFARK